ncbi:MAG: sugar ABC transporter permease [Candidatus Omnitrophota bacterium]
MKKIKPKTYKPKNYTLGEAFESYAFAAPLIILIALFLLLPVIGSFVASFFQHAAPDGKEFILLKNYEIMVRDAQFLRSLRFTLFFILVSVPLEVFIGLIFALLMNLKIPYKGILLACVLIPWMIPSVVSARIWQHIYNYSFGAANYLFIKLGVTTEPINWLGSSLGAFFAVVAADACKSAPFAAIIIFAGLRVIPDELYKQARIDRAGSFFTFSKITLPLIMPVIVIVFIFRTIDALRIFDILYVLTSGGPAGATTSLSLYSYRHFSGGDFGYASCISVVIFVIAFALSIAYIRFADFKREII